MFRSTLVLASYLVLHELLRCWLGFKFENCPCRSSLDADFIAVGLWRCCYNGNWPVYSCRQIYCGDWLEQRLNDRRVFRETHIQRLTGSAFFEKHKNVRRPKERDTGFPKKTAKTAEEVELNGIVWYHLVSIIRKQNLEQIALQKNALLALGQQRM